ncbi:MAG: hypothetical protein OHK0026_12630 [Rhodocyclaceae bacterium]
MLMLAMAQAVFAFDACRVAAAGLADIEEVAGSCEHRSHNAPAECAIHCYALGQSTVTMAAPAIYAHDAYGMEAPQIGLFTFVPRDSSRAAPAHPASSPPARPLRLNLRI